MLLRNKELRRIIILFIFTILAFSLLEFLIEGKMPYLLLLQGLLLTVFFLLFTFRRYYHIKKLSAYLKKIRQGQHSLDVRDNEEGELSILKNEIFKVTNMLSEYNENLKTDKELLANHIADISHQLKTPLTSMMVMSDLLMDENLPSDKRKQFIAKISSQLKRIEWLVSSLLTISKLDAGVIKMKSENVLAYDLINSSLEPLLISFEIREISYHISGGNNIIHCDKYWTREAIINILKNCMEHTSPKGNLKISASDNALFSEIKIADTGVGISKEELPHIFTRFYRSKNSSKDSVGIGLSMSRSIIKGQSGDITVESEVGKGSSFNIKLYKTVV